MPKSKKGVTKPSTKKKETGPVPFQQTLSKLEKPYEKASDLATDLASSTPILPTDISIIKEEILKLVVIRETHTVKQTKTHPSKSAKKSAKSPATGGGNSPQAKTPLWTALERISVGLSSHTHALNLESSTALPGIPVTHYRNRLGDGMLTGADLKHEGYLVRGNTADVGWHHLLVKTLPFDDQQGNTGHTRLIDLITHGSQQPGAFLLDVLEIPIQRDGHESTIKKVLIENIPKNIPNIDNKQHKLLYWPIGINDYATVSPHVSVAMMGQIQSLLYRTGDYQWMFENDLSIFYRTLNFRKKRWSNLGTGWIRGPAENDNGRALDGRIPDLPPQKRQLRFLKLTNSNDPEAKTAAQAVIKAQHSRWPNTQRAQQAMARSMQLLIEVLTEPLRPYTGASEAVAPTRWEEAVALDQFSPVWHPAARDALIDRINQVFAKLDIDMTYILAQWRDQAIEIWISGVAQ